MTRFKKFLTGLAVGLVVVVSVLGGAVSDRLFGYRVLDRFFARPEVQRVVEKEVISEESVVINVVEKVGLSVVTVSIKKTQRLFDPFENFWDPFGFFGFRSPQSREEKIEQDIGSGFIISEDGLVVTNKHVVEDTQASYKVITKDNKEYEVKKIYRDPANDLAILKVDPPGGGLPAVVLGDSDKLKVGQFVIAIGTALGEFRNTVTTGVISGLGRGISASNPYEGYVESLDNVIQTDAAINPGNSGGPLLNSSGEVIGVNVAVASGAQNIGFSLPINVVKDSLENFNQTGQFSRPFLGVRYKMISRELAIMNNVPEGAYVVEVVESSAAEKAGIEKGDIITKIDGQAVKEKEGGLAKIIGTKKVGDKITVEVWREGETKKLEVKLEEGGE